MRVLRNNKDRCAVKLRDRKHAVKIVVDLKFAGDEEWVTYTCVREGVGLKMGTIATTKQVLCRGGFLKRRMAAGEVGRRSNGNGIESEGVRMGRWEGGLYGCRP